MLSFGNDCAGPRGHGICSSFGQRYIALDQTFFAPLYFISIQYYVVAVHTYAKGRLICRLFYAFYPGVLNAFCLLRKTIPWDAAGVEPGANKEEVRNNEDKWLSSF